MRRATTTRASTSSPPTSAASTPPCAATSANSRPPASGSAAAPPCAGTAPAAAPPCTPTPTPPACSAPAATPHGRAGCTSPRTCRTMDREVLRREAPLADQPRSDGGGPPEADHGSSGPRRWRGSAVIRSLGSPQRHPAATPAAHRPLLRDRLVPHGPATRRPHNLTCRPVRVEMVMIGALFAEPDFPGPPLCGPSPSLGRSSDRHPLHAAATVGATTAQTTRSSYVPCPRRWRQPDVR